MVYLPLLTELKSLGVSLASDNSGALLATFQVRPILIDCIRESQAQDPLLVKLKEEVKNNLRANFALRDDGALVLNNRLCVPKITELKNEILVEAHSSAYTMHLGITKLYRTLKEHYWWQGVLRFGNCGKLSPRYIGSYKIIGRVGAVAYRLALLLELSRIHDVFHVSMLRKYIADPSHVLEEQPVQLKEDMTYEEEPIEILDRRDQVLRTKTIPLVKVLWRNHATEEATWEQEDQMHIQYPHLFHMDK
ncbi:hypothetical protein LWI29_035912 [Acer saccharum]|uniref:Retrotransposon protein n=1 Tax=Acer saccharum TaxID=4024 RepID=A0AA39RV00_ACESA|nr:hypothetical protein LWI29_035912 [Acer saccharum]